MSHQSQLEKIKYRNWVRGGLAYKYLKEGIEGFADDVVQQEHTRIISAISHTPVLTCNQCCLGNLRPLHKCEKDPFTGRNKCPWRQSNCNCLYPKKHPCPNQVCDRIMEDIRKSHGSTPPTPNWKNTDIQKWCSDPWEIAKCFINAPGYSDKTRASDIDTPGLLHVFINNINLRSHLSDKINGSDTFKKTLQRRNELFHSPSMEMEDSKLNECIDEIIEILEDEKELKARHDAQQAVLKLKQLKQGNFFITTHNEVEVCRDALVSVTTMSEELKQTIQDAKGDIDKKEKVVTCAIQEAKDDIGMKQKEATDAIQDAKDEIGKKQKETTAAIQDANDDLRIQQKEATDAVQGAIYDIGKKKNEATDAINEAKDEIGKRHNQATEAIQDATDVICKKQKETTDTIQDAKYDLSTKQREAIEAIQNKTQNALQEIDEHSRAMHERVGRLEIDSSISKQRLTMLESKVEELDIICQNRQRQLEYAERKQVFQKKLVELYKNHYVNTSISPLILQENKINIKEVYVAPKMVVEEKPDSVENAQNKPNIRTLTGYREILQTNGQKHNQVYIVGDVGTGKSTFCKMMIQNWCSAVTADNANDTTRYTKKSKGERENDDEHFTTVNDGNLNEMRNYDFLFFVPLQSMSGLGDITEMVKAMVTGTDIASNDFVDRIFDQESERCLIIADGLDEWTPPRNKYNLPHVSYGLPKKDRGKHATVVILSRPSAKGILNLKSTEYDQKVELLGINSTAVKCFIEKYLSTYNIIGLSSSDFRRKIEMAKLEHLEKTPLLLQQLVWLYCTGNEIGKSVSDTYSHIINIMLGWSQSKEEIDDIDEDQICTIQQDKDMNLPILLRRFPRCEENKGFLFQLAKVAFEAFTSETGTTSFGRFHLRKRGLPKEAITTLIKFGILAENNCFDPTKEKTQMEFIHTSYLEFLTAVHVSSHFNEQKRSILPKTVLNDLFQKCKSVFDVLHLSNVLKMICGLSPFLVSEISKVVSDIVREDEGMIPYRNSMQECWYRWTFRYRYLHAADLIQRLILSCLSMCDSDDQPMVSLCDVSTGFRTDMSFLQRIIPENVLTLHVFAISDVKIWRWIARLTRLQYMYIADSEVPHSEMVLLSSLIKDAPLKCFSMFDVECNSSNCSGHKIDLSKHDQLQKLELKLCYQVIITNINTKHLEIVRLSSSSLSNIDCLLNASSLTELVIRHTSRDYHGYNERVNSVVHTLQELRKLRFEVAYFDDSVLTVTPVMRKLEYIELWRVIVSQQTWRTFVDSLLTLQQSVQVDCADYLTCVWRVENKRNYVRRNSIMFEVMKDDLIYFCFRTKK